MATGSGWWWTQIRGSPRCSRFGWRLDWAGGGLRRSVLLLGSGLGCGAHGIPPRLPLGAHTPGMSEVQPWQNSQRPPVPRAELSQAKRLSTAWQGWAPGRGSGGQHYLRLEAGQVKWAEKPSRVGLQLSLFPIWPPATRVNAPCGAKKREVLTVGMCGQGWRVRTLGCLRPIPAS